ncbi:MAG TPA: hypothetical protein VF815_37025 [Myxococcaceae bacterium]|jgi:hypothetical protein
MRIEEIVKRAQAAHRLHWKMTGIVSEGDRRAAQVTVAWQRDVVESLGLELVPEFSIGKGLRERIDLVDTRDLVAYELKVSPNNTHFEFYRDIFKVIIARDNALPGIRHFVFITPEEGAQKLCRDFPRAVIEHAATLRLRIEVRGI